MDSRIWLPFALGARSLPPPVERLECYLPDARAGGKAATAGVTKSTVGAGSLGGSRVIPERQLGVVVSRLRFGGVA